MARDAHWNRAGARTTFTPTQVAFHFGPFYADGIKSKLANGDAVEVAVNGAVKTVHVKYGATVSG